METESRRDLRKDLFKNFKAEIKLILTLVICRIKKDGCTFPHTKPKLFLQWVLYQWDRWTEMAKYSFSHNALHMEIHAYTRQPNTARICTSIQDSSYLAKCSSMKIAQKLFFFAWPGWIYSWGGSLRSEQLLYFTLKIISTKNKAALAFVEKTLLTKIYYLSCHLLRLTNQLS